MPMAAAHKGKAIVLRWLGARQRLYRERRIRRDSASIIRYSYYSESNERTAIFSVGIRYFYESTNLVA